jgi:prepilin-type N-terminal cleavage/methylation domain-containing protein
MLLCQNESGQQFVFTPTRLHAYTLARSNGLTLIELVVVMTLLVLLAFVAAPSFVSVTKSAQLRTATREIVAVLRYARAKALSLGRPVLVSFDREQRTVSVLLPTNVIQRRSAISGQTTLLGSEIELTDEDWWKLSGERLETLDSEQFAVDPSPMGRERTLPEGVEIESIRDLDTGEELNLIAFYPDGTSSGAEIIVANEKLAVVLEIAPLTGSIQLQELSPDELGSRQR